MGIDADALLDRDGPDTIVRDGTDLGALFESLATLSVRVSAQLGEAQVFHFRTRGGEREVDLITGKTRTAEPTASESPRLRSSARDESSSRHLITVT